MRAKGSVAKPDSMEAERRKLFPPLTNRNLALSADALAEGILISTAPVPAENLDVT